MRWWNNGVKLVSVALSGLLVAACGRSADGGGSGLPDGVASQQVQDAAALLPTNAPIENLRIPLEHWPDGTIKTQINAAAARMPDETGDVLADRIRIETFTSAGETENLILAEEGRYNRTNGQASSEGAVHFEREGVLITGRGFQWNGTDEVVKIKSNVKVVLHHNIRWTGAAGLTGKGKQE
jgi:hypothetical protein